MVPLLVAAAVAAAGGAAYYVYKHWDEICEWFSGFLTNLKASIAQKMRGIANAAVIIGEKIRTGVAQLKHKLFYKEEGKWMEETTKREVRLCPRFCVIRFLSRVTTPSRNPKTQKI